MAESVVDLQSLLDEITFTPNGNLKLTIQKRFFLRYMEYEKGTVSFNMQCTLFDIHENAQN